MVEIKFKLDSLSEARVLLSAFEFHSFLSDLDNQLRSWLKHGHNFLSADEALSSVRQMLNTWFPDIHDM